MLSFVGQQSTVKIMLLVCAVDWRNKSVHYTQECVRRYSASTAACYVVMITRLSSAMTSSYSSLLLNRSLNTSKRYVCQLFCLLIHATYVGDSIYMVACSDVYVMLTHG